MELAAHICALTRDWFFSQPGGRIAVKVINHYGDEVLKVYTI